MTSQELTTIDANTEKQLAARLGGGDTKPLAPLLKVNVFDEDERGNALKTGTFVLPDEDGELVYAKTARVRPLANFMQYRHFDEDERKTVNRTILMTSFQEEPIDEKGTLRCGKPDGKTFKGMSPAEQKQYKGISCFRQIHALCELEGETATGEKRKVGPVVVKISQRGSNFMGFSDEVEKRIPSNRSFFNYWCDLSLEKKRNGATTFYVWHWQPDVKNPVAVDEEILATLMGILEDTDRFNKSVRRKYEDALRGGGLADDLGDADDVLDGDLADEDEA